MVLTMWQIRPPTEYHNPNEVYVGHPTLFSIELHHGGRFTRFPGIRYIEATVTFIDLVDIDEFSVHVMDEIMLKLGYTVPPVIYYHFQLPNGDLEFGLRALGNDADVLNLAQYVGENKLVKVYTEHGQTQLLTYFMSPPHVNQLRIQEIEPQDIQPPQIQPQEVQPQEIEPRDPPIALSLTLATIGSTSPDFSRQRGWKPTKGQSSCSKKLCLEWNEGPNVCKQGDQHIDLEEEYVVEDMELNQASNMVNDEERENVEFERNYCEDEAIMKEFEDFDPFFGNHNQEQHINDGEEAEEGSEDGDSERKDDGGSEGSQDSDFFVDEDNLIPDIEVDMRDFYMNVDVDAEYCGRANKVKEGIVDDEEAEDLDVIDNEEWESQDEDTENGKKRRELLKRLGKEKICSEGEVHKVAFHIGQKYKCKKTLKEKIDTHALETKRNLIFLKNDKLRLTAACDGKVPGASGVGENIQSLMQEFSEFDRDAYQWLLNIPPQHWARSHFSGRALSDMLLNNLCEVFNSKLINGRDKPIISCLEFIREYLMKRICNVMKVMKRSTGPLTPTATKILETNITNASQFNVRWNGNKKFQVQGPWNDQHVVDMGQMNCSCRKWELTCIPCRHAIATLNEMADNGEIVGEMYTYVHKVHWMETWQAAYSFKVDPIKGRSMWPKSACPTKITHPPHKIMPGRPQKKRRRSEGEQKGSQSQKSSQQPSETQKLPRQFQSVTCSKCKVKGHNARTCKGGNAGGSQGGGSQAGRTQGGSSQGGGNRGGGSQAG